MSKLTDNILSRLIPKAFLSNSRGKQTIVDLFSIIFGSQYDQIEKSIDGLLNMLDPYKCPIEHIDLLAKFIDAKFNYDIPEAPARAELANTIKFYKRKGTPNVLRQLVRSIAGEKWKVLILPLYKYALTYGDIGYNVVPDYTDIYGYGRVYGDSYIHINRVLLAIEALGNGESYNLRDDLIVDVLASKQRKLLNVLKQYIPEGIELDLLFVIYYYAVYYGAQVVKYENTLVQKLQVPSIYSHWKHFPEFDLTYGVPTGKEMVYGPFYKWSVYNAYVKDALLYHSSSLHDTKQMLSKHMIMSQQYKIIALSNIKQHYINEIKENLNLVNYKLSTDESLIYGESNENRLYSELRYKSKIAQSISHVASIENNLQLELKLLDAMLLYYNETYDNKQSLTKHIDMSQHYHIDSRWTNQPIYGGDYTYGSWPDFKYKELLDSITFEQWLFIANNDIVTSIDDYLLYATSIDASNVKSELYDSGKLNYKAFVDNKYLENTIIKDSNGYIIDGNDKTMTLYLSKINQQMMSLNANSSTSKDFVSMNSNNTVIKTKAIVKYHTDINQEQFVDNKYIAGTAIYGIPGGEIYGEVKAKELKNISSINHYTYALSNSYDAVAQILINTLYNVNNSGTANTAYVISVTENLYADNKYEANTIQYDNGVYGIDVYGSTKAKQFNGISDIISKIMASYSDYSARETDIEITNTNIATPRNYSTKPLSDIGTKTYSQNNPSYILPKDLVNSYNDEKYEEAPYYLYGVSLYGEYDPETSPYLLSASIDTLHDVNTGEDIVVYS